MTKEALQIISMINTQTVQIWKEEHWWLNDKGEQEGKTGN